MRTRQAKPGRRAGRREFDDGGELGKWAELECASYKGLAEAVLIFVHG
jgi:hypothetical protein